MVVGRPLGAVSGYGPLPSASPGYTLFRQADSGGTGKPSHGDDGIFALTS